MFSVTFSASSTLVCYRRLVISVGSQTALQPFLAAYESHYILKIYILQIVAAYISL